MIPAARRPNLSGYIQDEKTLLPWKWVDHRMAEARNYWVVSHSTGFPSARPVWGLWWSPRFAFSTGGAIARHLAVDPRVQVHLDSADELVILEGIAAPDPSVEDAARWADEYGSKYVYDDAPGPGEVFVVQPKRILAWISDPTGLDDGASFLNSATEWKFD